MCGPVAFADGLILSFLADLAPQLAAHWSTVVSSATCTLRSAANPRPCGVVGPCAPVGVLSVVEVTVNGTTAHARVHCSMFSKLPVAGGTPAL